PHPPRGHLPRQRPSTGARPGRDDTHPPGLPVLRVRPTGPVPPAADGRDRLPAGVPTVTTGRTALRPRPLRRTVRTNRWTRTWPDRRTAGPPDRRAAEPANRQPANRRTAEPANRRTAEPAYRRTGGSRHGGCSHTPRTAIGSRSRRAGNRQSPARTGDTGAF